MTTYIVLGAEGKLQQKPSSLELEGPTIITNDKRSTKGLYHLSWSDTSSIHGFNELCSPTLTTILNENPSNRVRALERTPRSIIATMNGLYVLSRGGIARVNHDPPQNQTGFNVAEHYTEDCFVDAVKKVDPSQEGRAMFVCANKDMRSSMAKHDKHDGDIFIAMWLPNKQEWSKLFQQSPNFQKFGTGGYLFVAPQGDLNSLSWIDTVKVTGGICTNDTRLFAPVGLEAHELSGHRSKYQVLNSKANKYEILSISATGNNLLLTDVRGGYALYTNNNHLRFDPVTGYLKLDPSSRQLILPTESNVCAMGQYRGKTYALLGLDDGKIRIYGIENSKPAYEKTIRLLSLDRIVHETDKDDHITGLKLLGDSVHLTLRNMYLRWDLGNLLGLDESKRISSKDDAEDNTNYLKIMKETYGLSSIIRVPHRITDFEIWS